MSRSRNSLRAVAVVQLVSALLCSGPALASSAELIAGLHAWDEGELARAEALLTAALRTLTAPGERGVAWLHLGFARGGRQDVPGAQAAMRRALEEHPELTFSRDRLPPAILGLFDAVRAAASGELTVDADESAAVVHVDGAARGTAPLSLRLGVGAHLLRVVSADGRRTYEDRVVVGMTRVARVVAHLVPRFGRITVSGLPAGATVRHGGRVVGRGPVARLVLPVGPQRVVCEAPGYGTEERLVEVRAEAGGVLVLRLAPASPPPPWYRRPRLWSALSLGLGVASLAVATGLAASGSALAEGLRSDVARGQMRSADYDARVQGIGRRVDAGNALFAVGAAASLGAAALFLLGGAPADGGSARVVPTVGGGLAAGLSVAGRF